MSRGMEAKGSLPPVFAAGLAALGGATLETLDALEAGQRRLVPGGLLGPLASRLASALSDFRDLPVPDGLESFRAELTDGAAAGLAALDLIVEPAAPEERVPRFLRSMRVHCRAQVIL